MRGHSLRLVLGVVSGDVMVEHDQEEEGDAQDVGEDGELHVCDHGRPGGEHEQQELVSDTLALQ